MTSAHRRVRNVLAFLGPVVAVLALAGLAGLRINTNTELANQAKANGVVACDAVHASDSSLVKYLRKTFAGSQRADELRPFVDGLASATEAVYRDCLARIATPGSSSRTTAAPPTT